MPAHNKENLFPLLNTPHLPKHTKPSIGQEIKSKVQKQSKHHELTKEMNSILDGEGQKSVRFDDSRPPSLQKHSSKSILKNKSTCSSHSSLSKSRTSVDSISATHQTNKLTEEKYQKIKHDLKHCRYTDSIYPPVLSSLLLTHSLMRTFTTLLESDSKTIEWMRLSDLYASCEMVVWDSAHCHITAGALCADSDYLATALNAIQHCPSLLQRIFGSQPYTHQGIYLVQMHQTQTNKWRNTILDDFIPVITDTLIPLPDRHKPHNVLPAFLHVHPINHKVQLWPYLLQKAYAKYYSNYDSLNNGNVIDFVQEITGVPLDYHSTAATLPQQLQNPDAVVLIEDSNRVVQPTLKPQPYYRDRTDCFKVKAIHEVHGYYCLQLHKYLYTSTCMIHPEATDTILRHFTLEEHSPCDIAIVQKEQRFFKTCSKYMYSWMRCIVLMKETTGYRWVTAAYSNTKSIKCTASLSPGHYLVVVLPEWHTHPYQFVLSVYSNTPTTLTRKPYAEYAHALTEGCMDIAQREGTIIQINQHLCSYNYIHRPLGLVIENINNEGEKQGITVIRSIGELKMYGIGALNDEFRASDTVKVRIKEGMHFTVILKTNKGVNHALLDTFRFDNDK